MGSQQQPGMQQPSAELLAALAPPPMLPGGKEVKNMLVPAVYRTWSEAGGCLGGVADYFARSRRASPTVYKSPYAGEGGVEEDKKAWHLCIIHFSMMCCHARHENAEVLSVQS
jgi:hypothetical protein